MEIKNCADAIIRNKFSFEEYVNCIKNEKIKEDKELVEILGISSGHLSDMKSGRIKFSLKTYKILIQKFPLTPIEFILDYEGENG